MSEHLWEDIRVALVSAFKKADGCVTLFLSASVSEWMSPEAIRWRRKSHDRIVPSEVSTWLCFPLDSFFANCSGKTISPFPSSTLSLSGWETSCTLQQSIPCTNRVPTLVFLAFFVPQQFLASLSVSFATQWWSCLSLGVCWVKLTQGSLKTDAACVHELLPGSLTLLGLTKGSVHQMSSCWQQHLKTSFS